jgi:hypothetical protein
MLKLHKMESQEKIEFAGLSLAVYREIAAHLRQVEGIAVSLIPQSSCDFDYNQSQISGIEISITPNLATESQERVKEILAYYRHRYNQ